MKKSLMILALVAMVGLMGTAEAKSKMYLVAADVTAGSVGIRGTMGNLSIDVWPGAGGSGITLGSTTVIPLYVDVYMGNLGVAFSSTGLTTTGATNKVQFQFAAEKMLNDDLGFGAYLNVVDYNLTAKTTALFSSLQSYVIVGFDM